MTGVDARVLVDGALRVACHDLPPQGRWRPCPCQSVRPAAGGRRLSQLGASDFAEAAEVEQALRHGRACGRRGER
eukprot:scaffold32690_cov107-Isochrysis_galbana.AAC.11